MAYFTREQWQKAVEGGKARGFSDKQVLGEMAKQGHQMEGLNAEERRTAGAYPYEQSKGENVKQVAKQAYNVGNEAFQFGKAVVTQPQKIIAGIGNLAVGFGKQAIEASSDAVSMLGKGVGLDIPQIRIPTFLPDGTVTYDEKDTFEQMAEFIGKSSGITSLAKGQPLQALEDVNKTLFEAPLSSALDIMGAGVAKAGKLPKIARASKTAKAAEVVKDTRPGIISTAAKGIGDEILQKSTGLGKENIQSIVHNPKLYAKADAGEITRGSIAHNVKSGIDTRLKEIGEAGRVYDEIRQTGQIVNVERKGVQSVLQKYGIEFDEANNRVKVGSESRPFSGSDIRELEEFFSQYGSEKLTANGFLNAREKLSQLSGFDATRTDVMNALARDLRAHYNTIGRPQIGGLKDLDNLYAPEVGKLKDIKREYLRTVVDENGHRVTILKDNAISRIMGSTNKGRDEVLKRLDDVAPGIGDEIRVLKALEDVELATGNKVGAYFRSGVGVAGVASLFNPVTALAAVPLLATAIITSPSVIARVLEWYGNMKGYGAAPDIMLKMRRTGKLAPDELGFVQEAVRAYEKAADQATAAKSPQAASQLGSKVEGELTLQSTLPDSPPPVNMVDDVARVADDVVKRDMANTARSYGVNEIMGENDDVLAKWTADQVLSGGENVSKHYKVVKKAGKPVPISSMYDGVGSPKAPPPSAGGAAGAQKTAADIAEQTPAEAKKAFEEAWAKAYSNRPAKEAAETAASKRSRQLQIEDTIARERDEILAKEGMFEPKSSSQKDIDAYNTRVRQINKKLQEKYAADLNSTPLSGRIEDMTKTKPQSHSPLLQEARKFDSAEEFVRAIETEPMTKTGKPIVIKSFHGTNKQFDKFELQPTGTRYSGDGIYFTPSKEGAKSFAGENGRVVESYLNLKNPYVKYIPEGQTDVQFFELAKEVKAKGHDAIIVRMKDVDAKTGKVEADWINEIVVFDTNAIQTKSQLTDIWKQANQ